MSDARADVLALLREAAAQAALTVVSQMQGKEWSISPATETSDPSTVVPIRLEGAVSASFAIAIPYRGVLHILELFLGESPEPSAGQKLTNEQVEILHEFIRQVMGLTVSQLRPAFGALTPSIQAAPFEESVPLSSRSQLSCECSSILLEFRISPKDCDALAAAAKAILHESTSEPPAVSGNVRKDASANTANLPPSSPQSKPAPESNIARYLQEKNFNLLLDIELQVSLRFGQREMLLKDILELSSGSVVELDRLVQEPVDLLLDQKVIARGEVVIIEGNYGVRVTEVATAQQRIECLC